MSPINRRLVTAWVLGALALQTLGGCFPMFAWIGGSMASAVVALPTFVATQHKARNASVAANVNTLRLALEMWATDHDGTYPTASELLDAFKDGGYLPGNQLPRNPYAGDANAMRQTHVVPVAAWPAALPRAGSTTKVRSKVLGPGHEPTLGAYDALTYGALLYDYDRMRRVYVVYGIGRSGKNAIVVAGLNTQ